uniref:uncharacterized protein n=1 Tax=Semicossyphus pulcher TaxID=241346 RepID=UPI0037E7184F
MSTIKTKLLYAPMVMALMSAALLMTNSGFKWISQTQFRVKSSPATTKWPFGMAWTTGLPGTNLNRKMFTLAYNRGGVRFYPPNFFLTSPNPWSSTTYYKTTEYTTQPYRTTTQPYRTTTRPYRTTIRPYRTTTRPYRTTTQPYRTTTRPYRTTTRPYRTTTRPYRTTTRRHRTTYPSWTTAPPTRGVSVCLRYLTAYQSNINTLFTLSPSTNPLTLGVNFPNSYVLPQYGYNYMVLKPYIKFWSNIEPEIWTRVCLTVDTRWNVVQLFSGSNMSIRKILPNRYAWSGEPVIDFPGFDGQVTDVQVWDYPLRYKEVFNYMTNGVYAPYRGSVLSWSSISYSPSGNPLLEDVYERQGSQPIGSHRGRGRRPKGEKATREFFNVGESKERNKEQFK